MDWRYDNPQDQEQNECKYCGTPTDGNYCSNACKIEDNR